MKATADVTTDDDGNAQARLQNSVPLGVNIDDPDDVVALVNPERLKSKRPRLGLGQPPAGKQRHCQSLKWFQFSSMSQHSNLL